MIEMKKYISDLDMEIKKNNKEMKIDFCQNTCLIILSNIHKYHLQPWYSS